MVNLYLKWKDEIDDYKTARPDYTMDHRLIILRAAERDGIPYCFTCHDWHTPETMHSGSGFGWTAPEDDTP